MSRPGSPRPPRARPPAPRVVPVPETLPPRDSRSPRGRAPPARFAIAAGRPPTIPARARAPKPRGPGATSAAPRFGPCPAAPPPRRRHVDRPRARRRPAAAAIRREARSKGRPAGKESNWRSATRPARRVTRPAPDAGRAAPTPSVAAMSTRSDARSDAHRARAAVPNRTAVRWCLRGRPAAPGIRLPASRPHVPTRPPAVPTDDWRPVPTATSGFRNAGEVRRRLDRRHLSNPAQAARSTAPRRSRRPCVEQHRSAGRRWRPRPSRRAA